MPRFIKDSTIINAKIQENIDLALNAFSTKIGGKPTYCKYFNKNTTMSEADKTLGAVYKTVGTSSPVVYKEIDNFPVYGLEQLTLDMQEGEYGFNVEQDMEVIILPNTISPLPDDFIGIPSYNNDKDKTFSYLIFKVTNVTPSVLGSTQFWKLSIEHSDKTYDMFLPQVKENLVFSGEDYKEGRQSILFRDSFLVLHYIRQYRFQFLSDYKEQYFDKQVNEFALSVANARVIDYSLKVFLNETDLFNREKNASLPKMLLFSSAPGITYRDLRKQFNLSLYYKLMEGFDEKDENDTFLTSHNLVDLREEGDHTNNIFRHYDTSYYKVEYSPTGMHEFIKIPHSEQKTLVERIKENSSYENDEDLNFLIKFFNTERFNKINVLAEQKELVDSLLYRAQKLLNNYCAFSYFFVPVLLYLMTVIEEQIVERETL